MIVLSAFIVTVHVSAVGVESHPVNPPKSEFASGSAVIVTAVPWK